MLNKGICPSREDPEVRCWCVCVCVCAGTGAHMTFEDLLCLQSFSLQHNRPINQGVNDSIYYSNRARLIWVRTTETKNKTQQGIKQSNNKHAKS